MLKNVKIRSEIKLGYCEGTQNRHDNNGCNADAITLSNFISTHFVFVLKIRFNLLQRPSSKELLKFPFIRKAKKNSYLMDLIDRFKEYKKNKSDSDSDSDPSDSYVLLFFLLF